MYFHSLVRLAGTQFVSFSNKSEEFVLRDILIPFINGQVVQSSHHGSQTQQVLINMKAVVSISIFKTEEEIDDNKFMNDCRANQVHSEYSDNDCTAEFVAKVKEIQANPSIRSLLEMASSTPEKQIFVIMKFGDSLLDSAFEGVIKPLAHEFNLKAVRVDEIQDAGKINDQILENIAKSRLVISDLSGERPNCYYETGFAHALGKEIILTIHKGSDIHFDLSSHRFIQWSTEKELRDRLRIRFKAIFPNEID